jgi:integrase/recombinase XerD
VPERKPSSDHNRQRDIRRVTKILRDGGYSYQQSKHLIAEARKSAGLKAPKRSGKGSTDRLTAEEKEAFLEAAYEKSGRRGLMMRLLLETGTRCAAFTQIRAEHISFREREIRVEGKSEKKRDVPILPSLARELRVHIGERRTGFVFQSPRGGAYSKRRIQQIVKAVAEEAGINKRVYPHLLRHTVVQTLADRGMPENHLQRFLGHTRPQTTQVYYEPKRRHVKRSFDEAMQGG